MLELKGRNRGMSIFRKVKRGMKKIIVEMREETEKNEGCIL